MKSLDNKIKYYELLMKYDDTNSFKEYSLPDGYHFENYKEGDEYEWVNIHISSGEFTSIDRGLKYFHDFYDSFINELHKRCIFIVNDETNQKVGTVTVSLLKNPEYGYTGAVDWLAIKKEYQGKGLSKPLISKTIELSKELGHNSIILHTQTTTWLAAKLYLDYGFEILNIEEKEGWDILKTLTNHPKLEKYNIMDIELIYDPRNVEIEKQLTELYKTDDFNYEVWYKNGLHNVYTCVNGISYEYEYFIEGNKITLQEVKNKKTLAF